MKTWLKKYNIKDSHSISYYPSIQRYYALRIMQERARRSMRQGQDIFLDNKIYSLRIMSFGNCLYNDRLECSELIRELGK